MSLNIVQFFGFFICLIEYLSAHPVQYSSLPKPFWHEPCGVATEIDTPSPIGVDNNIQESLSTYYQSVKLTHQLTLSNFLFHDFDYLYEKVRIGVLQRQYVPNWLPGSIDTHSVKRLAHRSNRTVS